MNRSEIVWSSALLHDPARQWLHRRNNPSYKITNPLSKTNPTTSHKIGSKHKKRCLRKKHFCRLENLICWVFSISNCGRRFGLVMDFISVSWCVDLFSFPTLALNTGKGLGSFFFFYTSRWLSFIWSFFTEFVLKLYNLLLGYVWFWEYCW